MANPNTKAMKEVVKRMLGGMVCIRRTGRRMISKFVALQLLCSNEISTVSQHMGLKDFI